MTLTEFVKEFYPDMKLHPHQVELLKQMESGSYIYLPRHTGKTVMRRLYAEYQMKLREMKKPVIMGMDLASGPDQTVVKCPVCREFQEVHEIENYICKNCLDVKIHKTVKEKQL